MRQLWLKLAILRSIAEAIERKSLIEFDRGVLIELKRQLSIVNSHMEAEHKNMLTRLDQRITADLGSKDRKENAKEVEEITEAFLKRYQPNLVIPKEYNCLVLSPGLGGI